MQYEPINDKVLIRPEESEKEKKAKAAGLEIDNMVKSNNRYGEVVAVGPGKYQNGVFVPTKVKVGHRVFYCSYGEPIDTGEERLDVIDEGSLHAVVRE